MEITFAKRMDSLQPGIFNVLEEKRRELAAAGRKIYNLSIGTPDFLPEPHVVDALVRAAGEPAHFKYALNDLPELISAVQGWYDRRYGVTLAGDEIMSVYGSQEGLAHIALALCDPGDIVLVPDPCYPIFEMGPRLCGARPVYYDLLPERDYLPDLNAIPAETADAARCMVVSYPANPVGAVANDAFYLELIRFAKAHDIIILHDNAYSEIIFDGRVGGSFLAYPGAREVGVEFNSLSKTYNLTGARISFVLGNREVVSRFRALRSQIDYGIFLPVQHAAIAALNGPQDGVVRMREAYQARRDALCGGCRAIGWPVPDAKGSMFAWAPLPKGYTDSAAFCFELLERTGLLCTPGAAFGRNGEGFVRFALVLPPEEIQQALRAVRDSGILG